MNHNKNELNALFKSSRNNGEFKNHLFKHESDYKTIILTEKHVEK